MVLGEHRFHFQLRSPYRVSLLAALRRVLRVGGRIGMAVALTLVAGRVLCRAEDISCSLLRTLRG